YARSIGEGYSNYRSVCVDAARVECVGSTTYEPPYVDSGPDPCYDHPENPPEPGLGALTKALNWLRDNQDPDGGWAVNANPGWRPMIVGTCLLAFAEAGHTATSGSYQETVCRAVKYMMANQHMNNYPGGWSVNDSFQGNAQDHAFSHQFSLWGMAASLAGANRALGEDCADPPTDCDYNPAAHLDSVNQGVQHLINLRDQFDSDESDFPEEPLTFRDIYYGHFDTIEYFPDDVGAGTVETVHVNVGDQVSTGDKAITLRQPYKSVKIESNEAKHNQTLEIAENTDWEVRQVHVSPSASVGFNTEVVPSGSEGQITRVLIAPGETVSAGQVLFTTDNVGNPEVRALGGGRIRDIFVGEGDAVDVGDSIISYSKPMLTLRPRGGNNYPPNKGGWKYTGPHAKSWGGDPQNMPTGVAAMLTAEKAGANVPGEEFDAIRAWCRARQQRVTESYGGWVGDVDYIVYHQVWSTGYWPETSGYFTMVASGQDVQHSAIQNWIQRTVSGSAPSESIPAGKAGEIVEVHVSVGDTVDRDAPLITTSGSSEPILSQHDCFGAHNSEEEDNVSQAVVASVPEVGQYYTEGEPFITYEPCGAGQISDRGLINMYKVRLMAMANNTEFRDKFEQWVIPLQNPDGSFDTHMEVSLGKAQSTAWTASMLAAGRFKNFLP
ncbi:MAG: hypothetical protein CMJ74_03770, partial [Planctomycetaceae bacterium]|nr:hypothetical protein [Planctomycetaceae bacterium]